MNGYHLVENQNLIKSSGHKLEGNNKKFVPDQNSLLIKRDDNTMKIKWIALIRSFTNVKSLESRFDH